MIHDLDVKLKLEEIIQSTNIASSIDDDVLDAIGDLVVEGYDVDKSSRSEWEAKVDEWLKLALQVAEEKTYPWPGAANVQYPLVTTAALQFSARAYPALIPGTNLVRGKVIGFDETGEKAERAMRVGKHMSYQLLDEMENWEEEMDRLLFALPIVGCMFKKTYFNSVKSTNVSEIVYPKDLVVNYWAKSLEDADRITHVLYMTDNEIYERVNSDIFLDQELVLHSAEDKIGPISEEANGAQKQQVDDDTTPYTLLEQCKWLDLDGDGYNEPYIITVDLGSKKVLRIVARFSDSNILYSEKGKVVKITPDSYYTKFSFIPAPDGGFYDIGFGVLLGPINETINTLINQLLDAGSLSNMQSGFISKGIRVKGGTKSFTLGEWKYANTAGDDLRKGIVPLPTKEPSQVLFHLLGMMIESGKELSSVTEIMTGGIPGQNTKATVAVNAIEQGMKVFNSIYKRNHRSLSKEFKKLFLLNSKYLPMETYFTVLDVGEEKAATIGTNDYSVEDINIAPAADPNVATEQQRLAKVQALFELLQLGSVNPQEVTRRYLEATEQPNITALMEMPPPQPNPEVEMKKQQMQFDQEKFQDESERGWEDLDIRRTAVEAAALKNIADAEAAEEGDQLGLYQQQLKGLQEDNLGKSKLRQMEEAHQQKQRQKEEAHQLQQQQKANQPIGGNNGTGTTGNIG